MLIRRKMFLNLELKLFFNSQEVVSRMCRREFFVLSPPPRANLITSKKIKTSQRTSRLMERYKCNIKTEGGMSRLRKT